MLKPFRSKAGMDLILEALARRGLIPVEIKERKGYTVMMMMGVWRKQGRRRRTFLEVLDGS